jgi:hypothetical protein
MLSAQDGQWLGLSILLTMAGDICKALYILPSRHYWCVAV